MLHGSKRVRRVVLHLVGRSHRILLLVVLLELEVLQVPQLLILMVNVVLQCDWVVTGVVLTRVSLHLHRICGLVQPILVLFI